MLSRLTINTTEVCNLACVYCYADRGSYGGQSGCMDPLLAVKRLDDVVSMHDTINMVQFIGGEPLLNIDTVASVSEAVEEYVVSGQLVERPSLNAVTNLFVLNEKHLVLLKRHDISLTVSLDGPRKIHNQNRPPKNGKGSFDKINTNLELLREWEIPLSFEATYTRQHLDHDLSILDLLDYLEKWQPTRIDITPAATTSGSICGDFNQDEWQIITSGILEALNHGIDHLAKGVPVKYGFFHELLGMIVSGGTEADRFCPAGESNLAISANGECFACHMLTNNRKYQLALPLHNQVKASSQGNELSTCKSAPLSAIPMKSAHKVCWECWANPWCKSCIGNMEIINPCKAGPVSRYCELMRAALALMLEHLPLALDRLMMESG
ncbi:MAG: radical SAM protein [Sedimenticola sp.]